jgi:hypothetical protein
MSSERRDDGSALPKSPPTGTGQDETVVERVVVSATGSLVTQTALVLSAAIMAQLTIRGPLPGA